MSLIFVPPWNRPLNATADVVPLGKLYFFLTGTTTQAVVRDADGNTLTQPIVADITGKFADVYLDPAIIYRAQLRTASDVIVFDTDPYTNFANALSGPTGAAAVGTDDGGNVQEALDNLSVVNLPGFRVAPHSAFSYLNCFPRVDGPGMVKVSVGCEADFRDQYSSTIISGTLWVDLTGGGSNSNDGSKPVSTGGTTGPLATIPFAVVSTAAGSPSQIIVRASSDPDNPSIQRTFTWANNAANAANVKIIRIEGHVRFENIGHLFSDLTFVSAGGGTPDTYTAPLADAWQTSHAYVVGDLVVANNQVWRCVAIGGGGMSAASGTGPTGTTTQGVNVTDNQVIWQVATPVIAVLWGGRKLDGYNYPLTRQTSVANVNSADESFCVVNGSISIRLGNTDISTLTDDDIQIIYSFDAFDTVNVGQSTVLFQGTQALWVVPPGSSLTFKGISVNTIDRIGERGALFIDAGDANDRRCKIFYPGSYCMDNSSSDSRIDGVEGYSGKGDNFHYTGTARAVEVNVMSWRAGSILTWGQHLSSLNGSAIHDTGVIARYGGDYQFNAGPSVADASNLTTTLSYAWNVALVVANGQQVTNQYGIYGFNSVTIWCDNCHIFNEPDGDVFAFGSTTTIHTFHSTFLTSGGAGTVDLYTPTNF